MKIKTPVFFLLLITVSILMHLRPLSQEVISFHSWRQTYTQSTILNFYEEDMNLFQPRINDRGDGDGIFRMEFPLMQWTIACLYHLFGPHLIISRLFVLLAGFFTLWGMFRLLKTLLRNPIPAFIGAWALCFSPSFFYYTVNPMPDTLALCFSVWSLAFFFQWHRHKTSSALLLSAFFMSLSALCKLPFILFYTLPATYCLILFFRRRAKETPVLILSFALSVLLPLIWYIQAIPHWHGNGITSGMAGNTFSNDTLMDYYRHILVSTLPELLINYGSVPFFLVAFYFLIKKQEHRKFIFPAFAACGLSLLGYYFFEANMIARVHDYYLFPFLPLLFILVAYGAWKIYEPGKKVVRFAVMGLLLLLPLFAGLRMKDRWNPDSPGFNKDLLRYKDELRAAVPDNALCIVGNDNSKSIFYYYIHKKGWAFYNDWISGEEMKDRIAKGAEYLYSDSRSMEENPGIKPLLDTLLLEKGSVRVYKLKKQPS